MKYNQQIVAIVTVFCVSPSIFGGIAPVTAKPQHQAKSIVTPGFNPNASPVQQSLRRHIWDVSTLEFSPDGKKLISGSFDETIQIWDLSKGKLMQSLPGHKDGVNAVMVTPDGKTLISAGGAAQKNTDTTIKVWNIANLDRSTQLKTNKKGKRVKRTPAVKQIRTLNGHTQGITALAISPDSKTLFSASYDRSIKQWDLATGKLVRNLTGHQNWVRAIAIAPNGKILVSAGGSVDSQNNDTKVRFWNLATGKIAQTLDGTPDAANFIGFTPDSQTLVAGSETTIKVWNANTHKLLQTINSPSPAGFKSFAINPNSKTLGTTSLNAAVKIWNIADAKLAQTIVPAATNQNFDQTYPSTIQFSPDGNKLAVGHGGGAERTKSFSIDVRRL